jgi:hypothetical protein
VLNELADRQSEAARALRERIRIYAIAADFNTDAAQTAFTSCRDALVARYGEENVWADEQSQVMHRLPLTADGAHTVWVGTTAGLVDARNASDLIAKLTGRAYFRKLFVRTDGADVKEARRICAEIISANR